MFQKFLATLLGCCLLFVSVGSVSGSGGNGTALWIDGEAISIAAYDYQYFTVLQNFTQTGAELGFDATLPPEAQSVPEGVAENLGTTGSNFAELLQNVTVESLKMLVYEYKQAKALGLTLDESTQSQLDGFDESIQSYAEGMNTTVDLLLQSYYGKYMDTATYHTLMEQIAYASAYRTKAVAEIDVADSKVQAYYDTHLSTYETVNFYVYTLPAEQTSPPAETDDDGNVVSAAPELTEDEKTAYNTAQKTKAEAFRTKVKDADSFILAVYDAEIAESPQPSPFTAAEAHAAAEKILKTWEKGAKTEDSFATLAKEKSEDNAEAGGLYEKVNTGDMVETFDAWCFDAARKVGDTGLVDTQFGTHVMYFVGKNDDDTINVRHILVKLQEVPDRDETIEQIESETLIKIVPEQLEQYGAPLTEILSDDVKENQTFLWETNGYFMVALYDSRAPKDGYADEIRTELQNQQFSDELKEKYVNLPMQFSAIHMKDTHQPKPTLPPTPVPDPASYDGYGE